MKPLCMVLKGLNNRNAKKSDLADLLIVFFISFIEPTNSLSTRCHIPNFFSFFGQTRWLL